MACVLLQGGYEMTSNEYRILVTGSRDWESHSVIAESLASVVVDAIYHDKEPVVVHGDCPTGADAIVQTICEAAEIRTERHPADWNKHGRAAGPIRNQEMVDLGANVCLAFPHHGSRGTNDCIRRAEGADIPVHIFQDVV